MVGNKTRMSYNEPILRGKGFGNETRKEFLQFLNYSRRSLLEVQSHLYVALDRRYINQKEFDELYLKSMDVKKLISGFIRYLKR